MGQCCIIVQMVGHGTHALRNLGMKIEIPEFEGKTHPNDFIDWLNTVERVFDLKYVPDPIKMKLLQVKFLPINHRQEAFLDYHNVAQRGSSVEDFIAEFDQLRMHCVVEEEDE
uniref:Retrotransposon gag domain-containing protein n=1 Tax=Lactuca sativa TaxID=4236 RepID=A0A9R1USJ2_LACSA|nr:hypothetical protein LSAT_V11C800408880 [Lactuca sativa]